MITVLVRVTHGPEALAATLSALVPAVAAGLIGDAVILADKPDDILEQVADAAGATLVVAPGASWTEGAKDARRDWLLCLDDGDIPQEGWIRVLDRFVALSQPERGLARMRRPRGGAIGALLNLFAILIRPRRRPRPPPRPHERDEGAHAGTPCRNRRARSHFPLRTSNAFLISDNRVLSGRRARLRAQPDPFRDRGGAHPRRDLSARAPAPGGAGPPARHREPRGHVLCHGPARAGVLARAAGFQRSSAAIAGLPRSGRGDASIALCRQDRLGSAGQAQGQAACDDLRFALDGHAAGARSRTSGVP